jgi:hypothetical protein
VVADEKAISYTGIVAVHERSEADGAGLGALFEAPPAIEARTSTGALTSFVCGLCALLAAPFSLLSALALILGGVACIAAVAGLSATRRPQVSGRALAPAGLLFGLVALALLGPRYAGVDTAFGDGLAPALADLLQQLNDRLGLS